jgi:uncharacterized protein YraI
MKSKASILAAALIVVLSASALVFYSMKAFSGAAVEVDA